MHREPRIFQNKEQAREAFVKDVHRHQEYIRKAFDKYGNVFCKLANANYDAVEARIMSHDSSKIDDPVEATGFIAWLYRYEQPDLPINSPRRKYLYQKALLNHFHTNSNHSEHWMEFKNFKTGYSPVEMDPESVVEMVLDWIALGYETDYDPADLYWASHKEKKVIHEKTKKLVDDLIDFYYKSKDTSSSPKER